MSDFDRFAEQGGRLPESVRLYLDLAALHETYRTETNEELGDGETQLSESDIAYQLNDLSAQGIEDGDIAGARALVPLQLYKTQGFIALDGFLKSSEDRLSPVVTIPRDMITPDTDADESMSTIAASPEARPFILNSLDIDAAHVIAQEQTGVTEPRPATQPVPDIATYFDVVRAVGAGPRDLSESECAAVRSILPRFEHNVSRTIEENELG